MYSIFFALLPAIVTGALIGIFAEKLWDTRNMLYNRGRIIVFGAIASMTIFLSVNAIWITRMWPTYDVPFWGMLIVSYVLFIWVVEISTHVAQDLMICLFKAKYVPI